MVANYSYISTECWQKWFFEPESCQWIFFAILRLQICSPALGSCYYRHSVGKRRKRCAKKTLIPFRRFGELAPPSSAILVGVCADALISGVHVDDDVWQKVLSKYRLTYDWLIRLISGSRSNINVNAPLLFLSPYIIREALRRRKEDPVPFLSSAPIEDM